MPDSKDVGKLIMAGFPGTSPTPELKELITGHKITGVILFKRNIESAQHLVELVCELRGLRNQPLIIGMDHEGGRVMRVEEPFTQLPPFRAIGRMGGNEDAKTWGRLLAAELLSTGIDCAFAPVMDVDSNPYNPIIGDRALSDDSETVARLGSYAICGMKEAGLLTCAKHFPGHGDTLADSHLELPRVNRSVEELEQVELVPFRAAAEASVDMFMTAHVVYKALDPTVPASLSPGILGGILRQRWSYDGVICSDDMEMKAIADKFSPGESAVLAVNAGCDLLLACHDHDGQYEMLDHLRKNAENGFLPPKRLEESFLRLETLQMSAACNVPTWSEAKKVLGCQKHLEFAKRMDSALSSD